MVFSSVSKLALLLTMLTGKLSHDKPNDRQLYNDDYN